MPNDLLNELNRNLANAEEVGNVEWAKALKKRIADLEAPAPKTVTTTVTTTVTGPAKPTVKKAVKKATKATKARKR